MIGTEKERQGELDRLYPQWQPRTTWQHIQACAMRFPKNEYIVFDDVSFTYEESLEQINRVADALYWLGIRPGDHIGVMLTNSPEHVWLIFALAKLGAVKVSINTAIGKTELCFLLNRVKARYLFSDRIVDDETLEQCSAVRQMILLGDGALYYSKRVFPWEQLLNHGAETDAEEIECVTEQCQNPDQISDIMFTSGSTSYPKGTMLTHDMVLRSAYGVAYTRCFELGRRTLAPVPLFHIFNYVEALLALPFVGGAVVMCRRKFNAKYTLRMLKTFQINELIILGSMLIRMLNELPVPTDYPALHSIYTAVCTPDWIWTGAREAFGLNDVTTGFGMTELCSAGVMTGPEMPAEYAIKYDGIPKRCGCAGVKEYNGNLIQIKIIDPETKEQLPAGQAGEICYRGVTVTQGYYGDPALTKTCFTSDGWFLSGDIGVVYDNGFLKYLGRISDTYKINGENVSPHYLDTIIGQCDDVVAVEIVGVSNPNMGEVGVAFVEPTEYSEETEHKIIQYCRAHLARFQVPKYFVFSNSTDWPHTPSGKLSKRLLREHAVELLKVEGRPGVHQVKV